ncbi:hypothetical protein ANI_1_2340024 [Paecilomyces variotii No. 5]|uniref:F-box domain protein n=1 Tax=Byssochlamys spectabilis (strain No. 5 / NBRC 109023) TaxID=1356009 RepID=V5FYV4_BYSSN|nr:hypothetical protein ANI_1_2340024 [Paecilomyces variotii No. 5]
MAVVLPSDVWYIILGFLKADREYNTIFQCAVSSRILTEPAIAVLYQLYDTSPVTGGGTEDEQFKSRRTAVSLASARNEQDAVVRKWALMWRSIILSTFDKTYLPYYNYIRELDLTDLTNLISDSRFTGKIRDEFYDGELGDYAFRDQAGYELKGNKRLRSSKTSIDTAAIGERLGAAIVKKAAAVRELSGNVSPSSLSEWVRGLSQLQALSLWSGSALSQHAEDEIKAHCPEFKKLTLFRWMDSSTDKAEETCERFLNGLRPHSLEYFEVISLSQLGPRSISGFGNHLNSLTELKLTSLQIEAIAELPSLKSPPALRVLALTDSAPAARDEKFYSIVKDVAEWICSCKSLRLLGLRRFLDDPALLSQALNDDRLRLTKLSVEGYTMQTSRAFHEALASQMSLQSLYLQGESSEFPDDQAILVQALGQLSNLRELELKDISENFTPDHVVTLTPYLPQLERLWISGHDFDDEVWNAFLGLPKLRVLIIHALSDFTAEGILDFISQLGPGNRGLHLSILNALSDASITEEAQTVIGETLAQNLGGTFDFGLAQEEYTESESEDD